MTNKRARNKRAIERAAYGGRTGPMGIQGDYAKYAGGNSVTIPVNVLSKMLQNLAPQANQAKDFAPGSPLIPYEGVVPKGGPRLWSFAPGININANDRTLGMQDVPSFAQLRNLSMLYSGVTLCERVILDMIPKLTPVVQIRKELANAGLKEKAYQTEIKQWMKFIEMPDPIQRMDIHSWLRMAWTETTQIDALSLFKQKDRGGRLIGLNIVDGTTMKPIIDERGMVPQPPWPAYQQYPYGVPGDQYTTDQVIYYRESPRSFTPYGFSRVERIILEVNQALRKKQKDLARWTEGNVPAGIMEVPDSSQWTPDQIDSYEQLWNALLAGNAQQQVRIKFTQPGMKYTAFADPAAGEHITEFDEFLLNVAAACYGLSMGDLAFTASIHKSADEGQQNMMYRRTLDPIVSVYARILTNAQRESTGCDVLEYDFTGFTEVEDIVAQSTAYGGFVTNGILSRAAAARLMNFPEIPETGPFILQQGGPPLFLEDLANPAVRKAQQDAQMAGLQMAATVPVAPPAGGKAAGNDSGAAQGSQQEADSGQSSDTAGTDSGDGAGDAELGQALDEADKSLSTLDSGSKSAKRFAAPTLIEQQISELLTRIEAIERTDPARDPNGEFGYYAGKKQPTGHHKTGTHKAKGKGAHHGPKLSQRERLTARMQKLSARFEKLENRKLGKKWSASQQAAAGQLGDIFSRLAASIGSGKAGSTDKLLDAAYAQAKIVFAGNPKGMNSMAHSLTLIDAANDKGIRVAMPDPMGEDDEDEFDLDDVEAALDELEQESEQEEESSRVAEVLSNVEEQLRILRARNVTTEAAKDEAPEHTGMMLAFILDPEAAAQLAIPGGEPIEDMHVTLAYLGNKDEVNLDVQALTNALAAWASEAAPLQGSTGGLGRFTSSESSDGMSPVIALVNVPGLQQWRADLVQRIESMGVEVAKDFDYTPHCTLAYIPDGAPMPIEQVPTLPLVFDALCLAIGDERTFFKIGDEQYPQYWEGKKSESRTQPHTEDLPQRMATGTGAISATLPGDERTEAAGDGEIDHQRRASEAERAVSIDYRRWRDRAIADVKAGRQQRPFESALIPEQHHRILSRMLQRCTDAGEVRSAFDAAKSWTASPIERESDPKALASDNGGNQGQIKSAWKLRW